MTGSSGCERRFAEGWEKAVTTAGGVVFSFDPDPKAARDGIKQEAAVLGKTISDRAAWRR